MPGQVVTPEPGADRAAEQLAGHLWRLILQPGEQTAQDGRVVTRPSWASSSSGVAGSRRVRPYRSRSVSDSITPEAADHPSTASTVAGVTVSSMSIATSRAVSAAGLVEPDRDGRLAVRDVHERPADQQPLQMLGPGRSGEPAGQGEQVDQALVIERDVGAGHGNTETDVGELRRDPVGRAGQPPGDRIGFAGGQLPAEQAGRHGDGREPVVQASLGPGGESRRLLPQPRAGHHPGAGEHRGQRMDVAGRSPFSGEIERPEARLGVRGERLGQDPHQVIAGVAGTVAVGRERHLVGQLLTQQVRDSSDPPGVLGDVVAHHQHRPVSGHGLSDRGQQPRQDIGSGSAGVKERLDARPVDYAARQRAG